MDKSNFGFNWNVKEVASAEEAKDLVSHDIEKYWGKECLSTSASYAVTLA